LLPSRTPSRLTAAPSCARAASGQVAAAPPRSVMKSRRRKSALLPRAQHTTSSSEGCVVHHRPYVPSRRKATHPRCGWRRVRRAGFCKNAGPKFSPTGGNRPGCRICQLFSRAMRLFRAKRALSGSAHSQGHASISQSIAVESTTQCALPPLFLPAGDA